MAVLKVMKGSCPGQILELHGERMIFGRHPKCQIVLDNAAVSRHHAQILESHGSYYVEDLRSRNGTHLNDQLLDNRRPLNESDEIKVCDFLFRFHLAMPTDEGEPHDQAVEDGSEIVSDLFVDSDSNRISEIRTLDYSSLEIDEGIDDSSERSSIISTLDAGSSSSHMGLGVKPEVKLKAVLDIARAVGQVLELENVLEKILEGLFRIFPQADEGFVVLKDAESERLSVRTRRSRRKHDTGNHSFSRTIVLRAMETSEAILSADAAEDTRFNASESLANLHIRSMICVPLVGKSETTLGAIQIATGDIRLRFSQDDLELLVIIASQASLAIENAILHQEVIRRSELERELDFATQIQLGFLPNDRPKLESYSFYDYYEAAQRVGGDYFDYVMMDENRLAVAIADVAGKGVPASLLMARLYSSARYHLLTQPTVAKAMTGLNSEIFTSGLGHRFITCVMLIIDYKTHEITMSNAGHLPPLRRCIDTTVEQLGKQEGGMPLGILPEQDFDLSTFTLQPGETVVLYTDGINEAMRPDKEFYGMKRLIDFIATGPAEVDNLVKAMVADVERFCIGHPQSDDMCLVCFQRSKAVNR